jgi:hypothetical protein
MRHEWGLNIPDGFPTLFPKFESWELELITHHFTGREVVFEVGSGYGITGCNMAKLGCRVFGVDCDLSRLSWSAAVAVANGFSRHQFFPHYGELAASGLRALMSQFSGYVLPPTGSAGSLYVPVADTLVMDVEGAEWPVLAAEQELLSRFGTILMELHGPKSFSHPEVLQLMEHFPVRHRKEDVILLKKKGN